jgi:hypothetical protein
MLLKGPNLMTLATGKIVANNIRVGMGNDGIVG